MSDELDMRIRRLEAERLRPRHPYMDEALTDRAAQTAIAMRHCASVVRYEVITPEIREIIAMVFLNLADAFESGAAVLLLDDE